MSIRSVDGQYGSVFSQKKQEEYTLKNLINMIKLGNLVSLKQAVKQSSTFLFEKDKDGWSLAHYAALYRSKDILRFLAQEMGDFLYDKNRDGLDPLHLAFGELEEGRVEEDIADFLIFFIKELGANPYSRDGEGKNVLDKAAAAGLNNVIIALVITCNMKMHGVHKPSIHYALLNKQYFTAKLLVQLGYQVNYQGKCEDLSRNAEVLTTCLHYVIYENQLDAVKFLIEELNADTTLTDWRYNKTPLEIARELEFQAIEKYLKER